MAVWISSCLLSPLIMWDFASWVRACAKRHLSCSAHREGHAGKAGGRSHVDGTWHRDKHRSSPIRWRGTTTALRNTSNLLVAAPRFSQGGLKKAAVFWRHISPIFGPLRRLMDECTFVLPYVRSIYAVELLFISE